MSEEGNAAPNTDVPKLRAVTPNKATTPEKYREDETQSILPEPQSTCRVYASPVAMRLREPGSPLCLAPQEPQELLIATSLRT